MAKLDTSFAFTGSLGNLSAYTMRGVDGIVVRAKGGASKHAIKTLPSFDNTRRINAEFGGRARGSKFIMQAMQALKPLADYNISGPLNSLLSRIQKLDTKHAWGQRSILLSENAKLLEGFSLNQKSPFDAAIRHSMVCTISRESHTATLVIPDLVPGINLFTPKSHAYFSLVFTLGVVPDLFHSDLGYAPNHDDYHQAGNRFFKRVETSWYGTRDGFHETSLHIALHSPPPDQACTLLAGIGIRYGTPSVDQIMQVKHSGAAKIMGVA